MIDDIEKYLFVVNDNDSKLSLINLFLEYFGFPNIDNDMFISIEHECIGVKYYKELINNIKNLNNINVTLLLKSNYKNHYSNINMIDHLLHFPSFQD